MEFASILQPCPLLDLPDELKLHVVNYIDKRRDLYNLSRVCRRLERLTMTRLYHTLDVDLSPSSPVSQPGGPSFRAPVTDSVRVLVVREGVPDSPKAIYLRRARAEQHLSVDGMVTDILQRVPRDQLDTFAFLRHAPPGRRVLNTLLRRHERSLQHLRVGQLPIWPDATVLPRSLTSFECRTVDQGETAEQVLHANRDSIDTLHLGQERPLLQQYKRVRIGVLQQIPQPTDSFFATAYALPSFGRLRDVALQGLNVAALRALIVADPMPFFRLDRLALESCPGSAEVLERLAAAFHRPAHEPAGARSVPKLQHFLFRTEDPTSALKDAVIRFLASFTGLRTLSLLFENSTVLDRPAALIAEHGPTLTTLVLESRIQPREHLGLDTSRPFGVGAFSQELWEESINDIARLCPNLVELGMGFPWNDGIVRLPQTALPTLQHLRTIHIRNFPENHVFSQLGEYSIKEYATKFIEWSFPALVGGTRPHLELLAIGPTLHESRWKSSTASSARSSISASRLPPEYLRTHFFCLDWAKTRFGRWSPLITPVSERFMEEMTATKPLGGVFEQVWLR